jgi:protein adenylyltransferase
MPLTIEFDNSYARLPDRFFAPQAPVPVAAPELIVVNDALARELGIDPAELRSHEGVEMLAGNAIPEGAAPLSQAYAGHQFGGWVPQLGDGRAVLLGEVVGAEGRRDLQLKGSGRTPFSRGGDGRAWLGPVLREYLVSETMHALGIPTTRALAAVSTGERVQREQGRDGAVLTRIAASHIRVGTFQYFAARQDVEALQILANHVIERHYPTATDAISLLDQVLEAQAGLIAQWMSVGFIHGVMNTDNMAVSGETIDYGPCAFMDTFHAEKVFSSIDQFGRYAWCQQPLVAPWNLAQFASCLLPLMGEETAAIEQATAIIHSFPERYQRHWRRQFGAKIGLVEAGPEDDALIDALLSLMQAQNADFTNTFHALAGGDARQEFDDPTAFDVWETSWRERLQREANPEARMQAANPAVIPRNHQIEAAISQAEGGDFTLFHRLNAALATPYELDTPNADLALPPTPEQVVRNTFCGT